MKVSLDNVTLAYGDVLAVKGLDLVIPDGESVVLLGQSGCGKTSTMRCIAGLEQPVGGTITIGDRVIFDAKSRKNVPTYRRNVGMVFQSYAVWPHKTVLQNVTFPLRAKKLGGAAARAKAMEVLDLVGLAHLADRGASMLSGGQMQRVALARSVAMEPTVLLLDEPLSNLDARLRDDLRVELRRIQQERGLTSLYVTHDQHEALALADQIAIMQSGHITQLATPTELYRHPSSASIARFLGIANVFAVSRKTSSGAFELADHGAQIHAGFDAGAVESSACFRAEAVEVRAATAQDRGVENSWTGHVRVAVFQGDSIRYEVTTESGLDITAICPAASHELFPIAARVEVSVAPKDVQVLPEDVVLVEQRSAA